MSGGFDGRSKEGRPLVSVITVCLNSEKYIEETIESVLGQTYENIEYIIVDGGSGDGTLGIIRRYEDRIAYWVSEPDRGLFHAMNKGISLSTGEFVGLINSDDRYFPYTVEEVVSVSGEDPEAQVYYGAMHIVDRDGQFHWVWDGAHENMERRAEFNHPACFIRRGIYEKYRYDERYLLADYDLMFRLHYDGTEFHRIDMPLAVFRLGGVSSVYYTTRRDVYRLRRKYGLMTRRAYAYKRCALPFRAAFMRLKGGVEKAFFPEVGELRVERGCLMADNIAMKEEINRASAHIDKLERLIAGGDAED